MQLKLQKMHKNKKRIIVDIKQEYNYIKNKIMNKSESYKTSFWASIIQKTFKEQPRLVNRSTTKKVI